MGSRGRYIGTVMPPFFHVKARPRTLGQPGVVVTSVTRNVYLYGARYLPSGRIWEGLQVHGSSLALANLFCIFASTAITDGYVIYCNV